MQTLGRKIAEVSGSAHTHPLPNREVQLLIVMHGFRKKKKKPLVVDEMNREVYSLV